LNSGNDDNNNDDDDKDLSNSAFKYFLSAHLVLMISLVSFIILTRLPLYTHHQTKTETETETETEIETIIEDEQWPLLNKNSSLRTTLKEMIKPALSIMFVFTVTLSLFPSITASIKSTAKNERSDYQQDYLFIPIHFLIFNMGDLIGRSLPIIQSFLIKNVNLLALMSASHSMFIPLILSCNTDIGDKRLFPLLVTNDWLYFFIVFLFSLSNGYLGSSIMMVGSQTKNVDKGLAGMLLIFCLVIGLTVGSLLSFPMRSLSCGGCNPFIN